MVTEDSGFHNQIWYIERMAAAGYPVDYKGHCFGMSHMAMQAFLAEDMQTFNDRLSTIDNLPVEYIKNDFAVLRHLRQELINNGKTDAAKKITETIVDLSAFFDGITLYQNTTEFKYLFEKPEQILMQDADKAMQFALPINLSKNKPALIDCHTGAYNQTELIQYITSMQEKLGNHSFGLILVSAQHAINLNYDAKTKQWILIDPNHLPGQKYTDASLLAQALLTGYGQKNGLVMQTSLYSTAKQAESVQRDVEDMKKTEEWIALHSPSKLNTVYEDNISQLGYAVCRQDSAWIEQNIADLDLDQSNSSGATPLMFACQNGSQDIVNILTRQPAVDINKTNNTDTTSLMIAVCHNHPNIVDQLIRLGAKINEMNTLKYTALDYASLAGNTNIMHTLMNKGAIPTENTLSLACQLARLDAINLLISKGIKPTLTMLDSAFKSGNLSVINTLIENGLEPTEEMLNTACLNGKMDIINLLIDKGMTPTEDMFDSAITGEKVAVIKLLIDKGITPTPDMLYSVCIQGNIDIIDLLIDRGITLERTHLIQLASNTYTSIEVITRLIDKGVILTEAIEPMLKRACNKGNVNMAQLLANKLSQSAINTMCLRNTLEKSGISKEMVEHAMDAIISNIVNDINKQNIKTFEPSKIRQSILNHLNTLANDQTSELGQCIQKTHNSVIKTLHLHLDVNNELKQRVSDIKQKLKAIAGAPTQDKENSQQTQLDSTRKLNR